MLRDTLEMVPVALVLAIVLGFGAKPSRPTSTASLAAESLTNSAYRIQDASAALSNRSTGHGPPVSSQSPLKTGQIENPPGAIRHAGRTFLPRRSFDPSVPYFTADDIYSFCTPSVGSGRRMHPQADPVLHLSQMLPVPEDASSPSTDETPRTNASSIEGGPSESAGGLLRPRVNINKAGVAELTRIPGIGGTRARILIESRPPQGYRTWTEIDVLPGFGPGTIGMLQRHGALEVRAGG